MTEPPLDGMVCYYGVWVTAVGDEGDLLAAGHPPLMRLVAAMNRYSRQFLGMTDLADGDGTTLAELAPSINLRWALKQTYADCDSREQDLEEGVEHYCAMCSALDDGNWWIEMHKEERPGSFPVTWMLT